MTLHPLGDPASPFNREPVRDTGHSDPEKQGRAREKSWENRKI
jgi:hypothetical protein